MLCGGDVADEICPAGAGDAGAYRRHQMIVPRSDVGDQGAQHVEGLLPREPLHHRDVRLDLVDGDVTGPLDDRLDPEVVGLVRQLAVDDQLLDLGPVSGTGTVTFRTRAPFPVRLKRRALSRGLPSRARGRSSG